MFYHQEDLESQKPSAAVQSSLTFPGTSHVRITGTCDAPRQVARTPAREELQAAPGSGEADGKNDMEVVSHDGSIHGGFMVKTIGKTIGKW